MKNLTLTVTTAPLLLAAGLITSTVQLTLPSGIATAQNRAFVEIENSRNLPRRGQSRNTVRSQFGDPVSVRGAVGDPPISSWTYDGFIVYFEYDHVITTVAAEDSLPTDLSDIQ